MLARWAAEDVDNEPDWDVNDVERMSFSTTHLTIPRPSFPEARPLSRPV